MLYVLGVHHYYQLRDPRVPNGMGWQEHVFNMYPEIKETYGDGPFDSIFMRDAAVDIWLGKIDGGWKRNYGQKVSDLIGSKSIRRIYEEGDGNYKHETVTSDVAKKIGIEYHNVEPPADNRPAENLFEWREEKWVEEMAKNYDTNVRNLFIIGEHHRINRFKLKCSIECKLKEIEENITSIPEVEFWKDQPLYLELIKQVDSDIHE